MPIQTVSNQPYGQGVEQAALQRAMPAPNMQAGPAPAQAEPAAPAMPEDPMAAAAAMPTNTGLLIAPDDQPDIPFTNGLAVGPGAGPEALGLRRGSNINQMLAHLAQSTGDSMFSDIAARFRV
jgi:hypothetical protein